MATPGLVAMHGHSLVAVSGGYTLAAVSRLLWSQSTGSRVCGLQQLQHVDSVAVAHGLSCPHSMWDLPRPGIKPVSPALAGGFLTARPPEKYKLGFLILLFYCWKYSLCSKEGEKLHSDFYKIWSCLLGWVWTKKAFSTKAACRSKEGIK